MAGDFIRPWPPWRPHKSLGSKSTSIRLVQNLWLGFIDFPDGPIQPFSRLVSWAKKTIEGRCRRPFRVRWFYQPQILVHRHRPSLNQTLGLHRTAHGVSTCGTPPLRACAPLRESPGCHCISGACVHKTVAPSVQSARQNAPLH